MKNFIKNIFVGFLGILIASMALASWTPFSNLFPAWSTLPYATFVSGWVQSGRTISGEQMIFIINSGWKNRSMVPMVDSLGNMYSITGASTDFNSWDYYTTGSSDARFLKISESWEYYNNNISGYITSGALITYVQQSETGDWNIAFSRGNHASGWYLTGWSLNWYITWFTETDPIAIPIINAQSGNRNLFSLNSWNYSTISYVTGAISWFITNPMIDTGDIIYGWNSGTPSRLGGNTGTVIKFLSQVWDGTGAMIPSWQVMSMEWILTSYLTNSGSATISWYLLQTTSPLTGKITIQYTGINTTQVLSNFVTQLGFPRLNFIPAWEYTVQLHASSTTPATIDLYTEIWEVSSTGVDISLIGTTESTTNLWWLATSEKEFDLTFVDPNVYNLASTASRIVTRVRALRTSGTHNISIFVWGTADSHTSLPASTVDATNFVPYLGSVTDLNLWTHNLLVGGNVVITGSLKDGLGNKYITWTYFTGTKNYLSIFNWSGSFTGNSNFKILWTNIIIWLNTASVSNYDAVIGWINNVIWNSAQYGAIYGWDNNSIDGIWGSGNTIIGASNSLLGVSSFLWNNNAIIGGNNHNIWNDDYVWSNNIIIWGSGNTMTEPGFAVGSSNTIIWWYLNIIAWDLVNGSYVLGYRAYNTANNSFLYSNNTGVTYTNNTANAFVVNAVWGSFFGWWLSDMSGNNYLTWGALSWYITGSSQYKILNTAWNGWTGLTVTDASVNSGSIILWWTITSGTQLGYRSFTMTGWSFNILSTTWEAVNFNYSVFK